MCAHAATSLDKFHQLESEGFSTPMIFEGETPQRKFAAYIDPDNKFNIEDKLSQVGEPRQIVFVFVFYHPPPPFFIIIYAF